MAIPLHDGDREGLELAEGVAQPTGVVEPSSVAVRDVLWEQPGQRVGGEAAARAAAVSGGLRR